jgi:hypothetical protein
MSLSGSGIRFIESFVINKGTPGGVQIVTVTAFPTGSYPALGEPIATLLAAVWTASGSQPHVATGVKPSSVLVSCAGGHNWQYDHTQGTMGSLRNWTAIGASPTEHATGVYSGTENTVGLHVTLTFPLNSDMTR